VGLHTIFVTIPCRKVSMSSHQLHLSDVFTSVDIPSLLCWIPLIKATMPQNGSHLTVLLISWLSIIGGRVIPSRFGFTYTQTVLFICFSWNQLSQPRANKNFAYALYAAAASLPLKLLAWLESMACGNFIIHYGGHLLYDSYIPLSLSYFIYAATTIRKNWQLVWSMRRLNS